MDDNLLYSKLAKVETQIKDIVGQTIESPFTFLGKLTIEFQSRIRRLMETRRKILNEMYLPTDENMRRFRAINNRLFTLTKQLHERTHAIKEKLPVVMDCPDFDDDFEIEGTLSYAFNDEESVLKLEDDEYYGSDFTMMIKLISDLSHKKDDVIEYAYIHSTPLDDGQSWNEYPFRDKKEFDEIIICHAVHQLTNNQLYSIPDLLRLNYFWAEVQLSVQSITAQDGTRDNLLDN